MATDYRAPAGTEMAALDGARMIADGIPYPDYAAASERLGQGAEWFSVWAENGRRYEALGDAELASGNTLTGAHFLWQACLNFHYAQFLWFHDPSRRVEGQRRKVELYARAAEHLRPASERVDVPFGDLSIPAYLRLPAQPAPEGGYPCLIVIGGLESTKEESYLFENMCLERGLATFAFDGPGQGEMFFDVGLVPDFERYASAVVDYLETRPELDEQRFGVLGRSLGGYYAVRVAACEPRLRACVSWGACFDLSDFDDMPPATKAGFLYVTGIEDQRAAREHLRTALDLRDVAGRLEQPTYVLHGLHDEIFPMRQVELLREYASNAPLEVVIEEHGNHCAHNLAHIVRPRMADWIARQLGAGG
jgi:2,6-dihydroxypseudooxynicotine hydrolase